MINSLIRRQRFIAALLFSIFYLNLCATLSAGATSTKNYLDSAVRLIADQHKYYVDYPTAHFDKMESEGATLVINDQPIIEEKRDAPDKKFIGGPGQPEMGAFQSASTSNMVDLFTGDFSYNLPLMDVGGYPVNIHYSSGISMDQEASWVGLGWNVNPGTIGRSLRGIPDDFNGKDSITRTQSIKENKTVGVTVGGNLELKGFPMGIGAKLGIFHNNYNGWGTETGLNTSINSGNNAKGPLSGSLGISNNSQTGLDVSPSLSLRIGKKDAEMNGSATISSNYNSRAGISGLQLNMEMRQNYTWAITNDKGEVKEKGSSNSRSAGISSYISFATPSYTPTITMPLTNKQFTFTGKIGGAVWTTHGNLFVEGYVSKQYIDAKDKQQKLPAYGYLHYSKATQPKVLLDFNREKDIAFNHKTTPHIAIPQYSYDIYSISGEGTGGMFRPYRGDVGYIYDHAVKTKSSSDRLSGDLGFGSVFHGGVDFSNTTANTETGVWKIQNNILNNIRFSKSDSTFEEVYFRNPGEKAINASSFYDRLGGDSLIRVRLDGDKNNVRASSAFTKFSNAKPAGDILVNGLLTKTQRDKRTQVITYLTAKEASQYGLEKSIKSYDTAKNPVTHCNQAFTAIPRTDQDVHKEHHISEVRVLNADGRRYVYGLPVYNVEQKDVTFAIERETNTTNLNKGLAGYRSSDNTENNDSGKDSYFNKDEMPAYAHSFLLTGLLSPDYVDIKGDGITEDDLGDGVKFNYTRVYGPGNYFSWRTPMELNKANYNEGLKTYSRDDKGTYIFGRKEVWYMHSIESKTMIALFKTSAKRKDANAVLGENGGLDASKPMRRLDSIELYVKADLLKNGTNARPVKTVHFEYNYELTPDYAGNSGTAENIIVNGETVNLNQGKGKLTLKKIWFSYNGNLKGKLNPYLFSYHPDATGAPKAANNPAYNVKAYDRWGNYKDPGSNPGGLTNLDYPYAVKDGNDAAEYAGAWHLTDIKLPSGGKMKVTYEADDYGYVQNKRAAEFFSIAGFGVLSTSTPEKYLYLSSSTDCRVVFVDVSSSVTTKKDIYQKYLEGIEKIYFKVAVKMPATDKYGTSTAYEFIPTYGEIENYGTVTGNNKRIWIQLKAVDGESPVAKAAIQFLRLNLPSKAYPKSELGDKLTVGAAVKMLASGFDEIQNAVKGFSKSARDNKWCKEMVNDISFIRLNNPVYKKYGGGVRVKKVEISDNWNKMTTKGLSAGMKESVYGQTYTYTTTKEINGVKTVISSGVATYEPMIGGEENPFRTPIEYTEKVAPLAPTNYTYTETPLGESFFPSPSVGYSKVRVRTINYKAKSANGWEESEFFTTKDFPTLVEFTPMDGNSKKRYNPKLSNFLRINAQHYLTVSQGFKIELNDMNGKLKSQASYGENDSINPVHSTTNFYKVEDDNAYQKKLSNTVWATDSANGHINTQGQIGKEVEIMVDVRQQTSTTFSGSVSTNLDVIPWFGLPPVIPIPSSLNLPQHEENRFRSIAVVKIVQRYGILDSIEVKDKGSIVSTKNMVYDGETGDVILSRTNNEFNDPIYNFSYPAHWAYSGMGMAYRNINVTLKGKQFIDGKMVLPTGIGIADPNEKYFESGDEIIAIGEPRTSQAPLANDCPRNNFDTGNLDTIMIWAIDAGKGWHKHTGIYFIDKEGKPYSANNVSLRILRSGKKNFTDASVGRITALASPLKEVSTGVYKIVIDSATRVINTSASVFNDFWKVENPLYQTDSCYSVYRTVHDDVFYPSEPSVVLRAFRKKRQTSYDPSMYEGNIYAKHFVASSLQIHDNGRRSWNYDTKSILKFDLSSIRKDAVIHSAVLNLFGGAPVKAWDNFSDPEDDVLDEFHGKTQAHQMSGALNGHSNESVVKQVFGSWDFNTKKFSGLWGVTGLGTTISPLSNCDSSYPNVTDIVDNMVKSPQSNYGFFIELSDYDTNKPGDQEHNSSQRTMSFCGVAPPSHTLQALAVETGCVNCGPPFLQVDYSYYKDTCVKVCKPHITDTTNPYRWGVLGNWRMERAYTFYHERKESNAASAETDIRKEGELKQFIPYWQFSSTALQPVEDTTRWVWNSAISQYNRKGFEIENYDPLDRYNSGLYGYNQTVPVAVAQNSKFREILFDGFEDYSYKAQNCDTVCQTPRDFDFLKGYSNATIENNVSHSGRHSLKINSNTQTILAVPLVSYLKDSLEAKVESVPVADTIVTGKGAGLTATYNCVFSLGTPTVRAGVPAHIRFDTAILQNCTPISIFDAAYGGSWKGKIQPKHTDDYIFSTYSRQSGAGIKIDGQTILGIVGDDVGTRYSSSIKLQAGKLYDIEITYPLFDKAVGYIEFGWMTSRHHNWEPVPQANLYPPVESPDTTGSVTIDVHHYCIKLNNVQAKNVIRPVFSPIPGTKMVISSWINVGETACDTSSPDADNEGQVIASFDVGGGATTVTLQKTGVAIEGWQRYEGVVNVPATATQMYLTLKGAEEQATYFDDIRMHPYNGNMKSFVYDPVNLRLMAELDENNYASFYEYDDDGTLIRVKKETEKGIKTIKESRSALFKEE